MTRETATLRFLSVVAWAVLSLVLSGCGASGPLAPLVVEIDELTRRSERLLVEEEARLVAAQVRDQRRGDHGALPEVQQSRGNAEPDQWPMVAVRNDTPHGLVVWFAGPCPRTLAIVPGGAHSVELCEGSYEIAAQLRDPGYLPFVGEGTEELENGSGYALSFYVVAEPH